MVMVCCSISATDIAADDDGATFFFFVYYRTADTFTTLPVKVRNGDHVV